MAINKIHRMGLAIFVIAIIIVISDNNVVSGQCQANLQGLVRECAKYVDKSGPKEKPSQECCGQVRKVDFPCVCKYVTPSVEEMISMEKAVYVAQFCGANLLKGTKCGSYTVPSYMKSKGEGMFQ